MSRLNWELRRDILDRILKSLPRSSWPEYWYDQARAVMTVAHMAALPKEVKRVFNNPALRPWMRSTTVHCSVLKTPGVPPKDAWDSRCYNLSASGMPAGKNLDVILRGEDEKKFRHLMETAEKTNYTLCTLQRELHRFLDGHTSTKSLLKAAPEFAQYMPEADTPAAPTADNAIALLVKLGWNQPSTGKE